MATTKVVILSLLVVLISAYLPSASAWFNQQDEPAEEEVFDPAKIKAWEDLTKSVIHNNLTTVCRTMILAVPSAGETPTSACQKLRDNRWLMRLTCSGNDVKLMEKAVCSYPDIVPPATAIGEEGNEPPSPASTTSELAKTTSSTTSSTTTTETPPTHSTTTLIPKLVSMSTTISEIRKLSSSATSGKPKTHVLPDDKKVEIPEDNFQKDPPAAPEEEGDEPDAKTETSTKDPSALPKDHGAQIANIEPSTKVVPAPLPKENVEQAVKDEPSTKEEAVLSEEHPAQAQTVGSPTTKSPTDDKQHSPVADEAASTGSKVTSNSVRPEGEKHQEEMVKTEEKSGGNGLASKYGVIQPKILSTDSRLGQHCNGLLPYLSAALEPKNDKDGRGCFLLHHLAQDPDKVQPLPNGMTMPPESEILKAACTLEERKLLDGMLCANREISYEYEPAHALEGKQQEQVHYVISNAVTMDDCRAALGPLGEGSMREEAEQTCATLSGPEGDQLVANDVCTRKDLDNIIMAVCNTGSSISHIYNFSSLLAIIALLHIMVSKYL